MASEITVSTYLRVIKGSINLVRQVLNNVVTMTGDDHALVTQVVPTTAGGTALTIAPAIGTCGYAHFRNLDATNYIEIGVQVSAAFYPFMKLKAGESAVLRLGTNAPYALANTASVRLEHWIVED